MADRFEALGSFRNFLRGRLAANKMTMWHPASFSFNGGDGRRSAAAMLWEILLEKSARRMRWARRVCVSWAFFAQREAVAGLSPLTGRGYKPWLAVGVLDLFRIFWMG
jgi:hypothetical protein